MRRWSGEKGLRYDDWTVTPNLWGAVIGRPGVMKSPALTAVMKPLQRIESDAREDYQEALRDHKAAKLVAEETEKLRDAAPCAEWRAIIALCRFCGLRCPSEVLALTWEDVLWDQGKLRVPVPKLEHIEGKGERFTPLFAPVREALDDLRELVQPGMVHVITRYRDAGQNLRTMFKKIIGRAGLTPWPRPLHNLRLSCQTELSSHLPAHAVCEMLGNSEAVAREHYLRTTDADFEKALALFGATRQTTQNASESASHDRNGDEQDLGKPLEKLEERTIPYSNNYTRRVWNHDDSINENIGFREIYSKSVAESVAFSSIDPSDLAYLQERWPMVPEDALIEALQVVYKNKIDWRENPV